MSHRRPAYFITQAPRRGVHQGSLAHLSLPILSLPNLLQPISSYKRRLPKAEIVILADEVGECGEAAEANTLAVATITAILQQDNALPLLRRLVEALRQANIALYCQQRQNWGARLIAAVFMGRDLYVACVGNMQAYLIRQQKPYLLTDTGHTRHHYLGKSVHTPICYTLQHTPGLLTRATAQAYRMDVQFRLEPNDIVLLCSGGLDIQAIQAAACNRSPGRIADHLVKIANKQGHHDAKAMTVYWRPQSVWQKARRLSLVFAMLMLGMLIVFGSLPTRLTNKLIAQQRPLVTAAPSLSPTGSLLPSTPPSASPILVATPTITETNTHILSPTASATNFPTPASIPTN